uniref:Ig-like domain-containing protein n=1 Tax=Eptatretus burgeri TaxID=7764 RepID=A0A8C4QNS7_EPTBU
MVFSSPHFCDAILNNILNKIKSTFSPDYFPNPLTSLDKRNRLVNEVLFLCSTGAGKGRAIGFPYDLMATVVTPQMKNVQNGGGFELHCAALSNLGTLTWKHNGQEVHSDDVYILRKDTLVVLAAKEKHSGTYECVVTESGITRSIATYTVKVFALPPDTAPRTQQAGTSAVVVLSLLFVACVCIICFLLWLLHKKSALPCTRSQAQSVKSSKGSFLNCCSLNKSGLNGTRAPVMYSSHESMLDKLKVPGSSTMQALPNNYEDDPPQCLMSSSNKPFIVINSETTRDAESSI